MTTRSQFAVALDALINATGVFSQREWAYYLLTTEAVISQWLSDAAIPRPYKLLLLLTTLEGATDVTNKGAIKAFKEMAQKPALEVSPINGHKMLPTVWEYMTRSPFVPKPGEQERRLPATQEKPAEERILPKSSEHLTERLVVGSE